MALKEIRCELSWSASRAREFERCRREYWYSRYASWAWWKEQPPGEKHRIMVHKQLSSLPAFAGDCLHRAIARWFELRRSGGQMSAQELYEEARDLFRDGWRESSGDGWKARPNKSVHLEEHQYGVPLPPERLEAVRTHLERCARNFCEMPALEPVRLAHPDGWRAVESLDTYLFLGTKVYAVPDFAYVDGERLHIWDWKTGQPREEDLFQLHTYALYACEKWGSDPEQIVLHAAYVGVGEVKTVPVAIDRLSEVQDHMSASVRAMLDLHYDPEEDPLVMEQWPASGVPAACPTCRFRALCEK